MSCLMYCITAINDLSATICVTSPVDFFIYFYLFSATNKILVDQASGRLTISRLLGGSPTKYIADMLTKYKPIIRIKSVRHTKGSLKTRGICF